MSSYSTVFWLSPYPKNSEVQQKYMYAPGNLCSHNLKVNARSLVYKGEGIDPVRHNI